MEIHDRFMQPGTGQIGQFFLEETECLRCRLCLRRIFHHIAADHMVDVMIAAEVVAVGIFGIGKIFGMKNFDGAGGQRQPFGKVRSDPFIIFHKFFRLTENIVIDPLQNVTVAVCAVDAVGVVDMPAAERQDIFRNGGHAKLTADAGKILIHNDLLSEKTSEDTITPFPDFS